MELEEVQKLTEELSQKRRKLSLKIQEIQNFLSRHPNHHHYNKKKDELDTVMDEIKGVNLELKKLSNNEFAILKNIIGDSTDKEVYNRIRIEVRSRMSGEPPKIISFLRSKDEEKLERFNELEKKME